MEHHTFIYDNGLRHHHLFLKESQLLALHLWYLVGSAHEGEDGWGTAHFLEHLMFKGSQKVPPEAHARIIQRMGGSANAFTTEEYTVMTEVFPEKESLKVLEMEADRMENLLWEEETYQKEWQVVREEHEERVHNQPMMRVMMEVRQALFGDHPFAHDPSGSREHLAKMTMDKVRSFYERYYHPGNAVLITAGGITMDELKSLVHRTLGKVAKKGEVPPAIPPFKVKATHYRQRIPFPLDVVARVTWLPHDPQHVLPAEILQMFLSEGPEAPYQKLEKKEASLSHGGVFFYPTQAGDLWIDYGVLLPFFPKGKGKRQLSALRDAMPLPNNDEEKALLRRYRIQRLNRLFGTERFAYFLGEAVVMRGDPEEMLTWEDRLKHFSHKELEKLVGEIQQAPKTELELKGRWWRRTS